MREPWADTEVEEAILAYLREHPAAMDSREAITEGWIMRRIVRAEVEAVGRVLERLTAAGLLEALDVNGDRHYRLAGTRGRGRARPWCRSGAEEGVTWRRATAMSEPVETEAPRRSARHRSGERSPTSGGSSPTAAPPRSVGWRPTPRRCARPVLAPPLHH